MDTDRNKNLMFLSIAICAVSVAIFAIIAAFMQIKSTNRIVNVISVDGVGSVNAVPNVGVINLNIREVAKNTEDAGKMVKEKAQNVLKSLSEMGINPEDIKTESYNLAPKYEYPQMPACLKIPCPPPAKPILIGYEASQAITVKVRMIDKMDALFETFGKLNITEFFGPNFVVDDMGKSKDEARTKAINDAKIKAQKLSKELGINLGRITSFNEQNNMFQPSFYRAKQEMALSSSANNSTTPGENKIISNVTISYEIN